jgi:hypothetical protein
VKPDVEALLAGRVAESLSDAENRRLYGAALEDQAVFDALAEQDELSEVLGDQGLRQRLAQRLADAKPATGRTRSLQPVYWLGTLAAAAGVAVVLWSGRPQPGPVASAPASASETRPLGRGLTPRPDPRATGAQAVPLLLNLVFDLPLQDGGAKLVVSGGVPEPTLVEGEALRLGLTVDQPADVLLVEERPDGSRQVLYPLTGATPTRLEAGARVLVPPQGQPDRIVTGPPGVYRVRLAVFRPGIDPLALPNGTPDSHSVLAVVERLYRVEGR